jgi:GNAT superfamily N-acetyltransferase
MGLCLYTPGMIIRKATMGDLEAMVAMVGSLFSLEPDFAADPAKQRRGLEAILGSDAAAAFVAEADAGRAVGMVTVQLAISTAEGGPSGLLEDLFVEEEHRRRGVAAGLVGAVEAWCAERGATRVQLLADRGNERALRFYDAAGYLPTRMVARRRMLQGVGEPPHFSS